MTIFFLHKKIQNYNFTLLRLFWVIFKHCGLKKMSGRLKLDTLFLVDNFVLFSAFTRAISSTHLLLSLICTSLYKKIDGFRWPRLRCDFVQKKRFTPHDSVHFCPERRLKKIRPYSQSLLRWMIKRLCLTNVYVEFKKEEEEWGIIALSATFKKLLSFHVKYFVHNICCC